MNKATARLVAHAAGNAGGSDHATARRKPLALRPEKITCRLLPAP
jgi:hypothetical protein